MGLVHILDYCMCLTVFPHELMGISQFIGFILFALLYISEPICCCCCQQR